MASGDSSESSEPGDSEARLASTDHFDPDSRIAYDLATAAEPVSSKQVRLTAIHDAIRSRICLLKYPPGTTLRETELAEEFGVSRTPIREVLQRLALGGLVEARNGIGTIVTSITIADLRDIYEARMKIAELIGELSPREPDDATLARIHDLRVRAEGFSTSPDVEEYWAISHEMHFIIRDLIGNSVIRAIWDQLYFLVARIWYGQVRDSWSDVATELAREFVEVERAIQDRDMRAVGYIQRNAIAAGMRRVMDNAEESPPGADTLA